MTIPSAPRLPWIASHPVDPAGNLNTPEDQPPGILARLFGGNDPGRGGFLGHSDTMPLARNALLQAGLSMLKASGPSMFRPSFGSILAAGIEGGQGAYQQGFESRVANLQAAGDIAKQQRRDAILAKYAGKSDLRSLQGMLSDLLAIGDVKGADALAGYLANAVNAQGGGTSGGRPMTIQSGDETLIVDPKDPTRVLARFPGAQNRGGLETLTAYQRLQDERLQRQTNSTIVNTAVDNYQKRISPIRDALSTINRALSLENMALEGNGPARNQFVVAFVKSIDPGSVAREGEVDLARRIVNLQGQAAGYIDTVTGGVSPLIPKALIVEMAKVLKENAQWYHKNWSDVRTRYDAYAKRVGIEPGDDIFEPPPPLSVNGNAKKLIDAGF